MPATRHIYTSIVLFPYLFTINNLILLHSEFFYVNILQESLLPDVFISYSWSNSHSAAEKSGKFGPGALGWADPRQIKAVLQEAGIRCWIDIEMVGKEKVNFLTLCILGNFACFLSSADFFS